MRFASDNIGRPYYICIYINQFRYKIITKRHQKQHVSNMDRDSIMWSSLAQERINRLCTHNGHFSHWKVQTTFSKYFTVVTNLVEETKQYITQQNKHICIFDHFSTRGRSRGSHLRVTYSANSEFAPGQWEMSLQSNTVSHWLGANLESAL